MIVFKGKEEFRVLVEENSLYLQKDLVRFECTHEIPVVGEIDGKVVEKGRRVSIMLRDVI